MRSAFLAVLIVSSLALAACGNKGGLYLPEDKPAPKAPAPAKPAPATPADPAK
jgi:predicted small lipoprotein YifL